MADPAATEEPMRPSPASDAGSGSSDDDCSSDDDAYELGEKDMASMQALEEALKADPKAYDSHVQVSASCAPEVEQY